MDKRAMRYIVRVGEGWQVKCTAEAHPFTLYFAFSKHGGNRRALAAAKQWRDEQLNAPLKKRRKVGVREARECKNPECPRPGRLFNAIPGSATQCCGRDCAAIVRGLEHRASRMLYVVESARGEWLGIKRMASAASRIAASHKGAKVIPVKVPKA